MTQIMSDQERAMRSKADAHVAAHDIERGQPVMITGDGVVPCLTAIDATEARLQVDAMRAMDPELTAKPYVPAVTTLGQLRAYLQGQDSWQEAPSTQTMRPWRTAG
jgi:hypothetical protein